MKKSKSLKWRVLKPIILVAVLGFLFTTVCSYFISSSIISSDIELISSEKAEKISSTVDEFINARISEIKILSDASFVKNLSYAEFENYINQRSDIFGTYISVSIGDANGLISNNKGKKANIADRAYFKEMISTGKTVLSEPLISKTTGAQSIVICSPIKNDSGSIIGVVNGTIELSKFSNVITSEKFGETGYAFMIDKKGTVIVHPNKSMIFKSFMNYEGSTDLNALTQNMIDGKTGVETYVYEGIKKYAGYSPVKSTGWSVAITREYSEAYKSLTYMTIITLIISIVVLLILILLIYIIINQVVKSISAITETAKILAKGHLIEKDMVCTSNDELMIMTEAFNSMKNNLRTIVKKVYEIAFSVTMASNVLNKNINISFEAGNQISCAIEELAADAETQSTEVVSMNDKIESTYNNLHHLSEITKDMLNKTRASDKEIEGEIKTISTNIEDLCENTMKVFSSAKMVMDISGRFAANGEEIAAAIEEQVSSFKQMVETSDKLDMNVKELENAIKVLNLET